MNEITDESYRKKFKILKKKTKKLANNICNQRERIIIFRHCILPLPKKKKLKKPKRGKKMLKKLTDMFGSRKRQINSDDSVGD